MSLPVCDKFLPCIQVLLKEKNTKLVTWQPGFNNWRNQNRGNPQEPGRAFYSDGYGGDQMDYADGDQYADPVEFDYYPDQYDVQDG